MAEHGNAPFSGPETVEALTADRMRMWSGFTSATTGAVILVTVVLIGMAVFLL
jgi:hypothetical protein